MATLQIRLDDTLKDNSDKLFNSLGMDTSTAIRTFLTLSVENKGLPFEVRHNENYSLAKAIEETRNKVNLNGPFDSAEEAIAEMLRI